jgi:hypothetical protein
MANIPAGPILEDNASNLILNHCFPDPGRRAIGQNVDLVFLRAKRQRVKKVKQLISTIHERENARLLLHNAEHRAMGANAGVGSLLHSH